MSSYADSLAEWIRRRNLTRKNKRKTIMEEQDKPKKPDNNEKET